MVSADLQYVAVVQGKHACCPHCGVLVMLRVDEYGCCRQRGGCRHIGSIEQWDGELRVGYFSPDQGLQLVKS